MSIIKSILYNVIVLCTFLGLFVFLVLFISGLYSLDMFYGYIILLALLFSSLILYFSLSKNKFLFFPIKLFILILSIIGLFFSISDPHGKDLAPLFVTMFLYIIFIRYKKLDEIKGSLIDLKGNHKTFNINKFSFLAFLFCSISTYSAAWFSFWVLDQGLTNLLSGEGTEYFDAPMETMLILALISIIINAGFIFRNKLYYYASLSLQMILSVCFGAMVALFYLHSIGAVNIFLALLEPFIFTLYLLFIHSAKLESIKTKSIKENK